ncbi:MAG: efflux RND transporter permease subunit, partial [Deltaproteobacteria bacterium]|nr:efflux RND transporter permease subunit [Deltaproteobacteria bacterium]
MKGLISFAVKRGIATAVLVLVVVAFGAYNYLLLKLDMFPELTFPTVVIVTTYTGAGPADIETLVSRPIEQAVASVKGVKKLRSYSMSGSSIVLAEFNWGHDMKAAEREVQKYLDIFNQALPTDVLKPIAFSIDTSLMPIMMLGVSGPYAPAEVRKIAKDVVKPRLDRVDGVAAVDIEGGQQRQINVFIDPQRMRALGVSATTVVNALRGANMQVPGGQVDDGDKSYTIETEGQFASVDEINRVVVGNREGRMLTVDDVAEVQDGFVESRAVSRDNGQDSVMLSIRRQSDANTVLTARAIRKAIDEMRATLPPGVKITTLMDQSEMVTRAISNLADTAWQALLITMLVLLVFLGSFRGSIVVGVTMPVSLIATFGVMGQMGVTLNMISMAGLALAIGMLVDNSVVVVENVFRHFKKGGVSAAEASVQGTSEVAVAVTAATLCHLVVFGPILFVPGFASQIFRDMALTICFSLLISLFVALTLMPMLTARLVARGLSFDTGTRRRVSPFKSIAARVDRIVPFYIGLLDGSFRHKNKVLLGGLAIFALSLAATALWLNVDFMAQSDVGEINLTVKVQPGTTIKDFDALARRAEKEISAEVPEAAAVEVQFGETEGFGAF